LCARKRHAMIHEINLSQEVKEAQKLVTAAAMKLGGVVALAGVGRPKTSALATAIEALQKAAIKIAQDAHSLDELGAGLGRGLDDAARVDLLDQAGDAVTDFVQALQAHERGEVEKGDLESARRWAYERLAEAQDVQAALWDKEQRQQLEEVCEEYADAARAIELEMPLLKISANRARFDHYRGLVAGVARQTTPEAKQAALAVTERIAAQFDVSLLTASQAREYEAVAAKLQDLKAESKAPAQVTTETAREIEPWLSDLEAEATRAIEGCAGYSRLLYKAIEAWNKAAGKGAALPAPYRARFNSIQERLFAKLKEVETSKPN
jgi:hypothetical protein